MDILFRGTHPDDFWYQAACAVCGTRIKFQRKEAQHDNGGKEPLLTMGCPVCHETMTTSTRYEEPSGNYRDR